MARGQYEQPPGRPKPTFGPPRPPIFPRSPTRSCSDSSPSSTSSSPTSSFGPPATEKTREVIVILSIPRSEKFDCQIRNLKLILASEAVFQEVGTIEEALRAFARKPRAVVVNEDALQELSFEHLKSEASRYVQRGGCLITDPSQAHFALSSSFGLNAGEGFKVNDRVDQALLERTVERPTLLGNSYHQ